jgi:uncharacterized protein (TIGR03435 family)
MAELACPLATASLYQVIAKTGKDPIPPETQFRSMLQSLLIERFQLKIHHVTKDRPSYDLIVAKGGPKLKTSTEDTKFSLLIDSGGQDGKLTRIVAKHAPIASVVGQFTRYSGRPVFDKTGLAGFYDFALEWAPESKVTEMTEAPDVLGPSLFSAIQRQLELKLEPGTAQFDTLVVDHAERPSSN